MPDDGNHILFSGCAADRGGGPAQHATIALAKKLQIDLWEAPEGGCCGARADRRVGDEARQQTLAPVYEGARRGLDVVCLSPACRRVVAAHAPRGSGDGQQVTRVLDVAGLLADDYGLARLAADARVGLTGLRVALHTTCHGDHNVVVRGAPSGGASGRAAGFGAALVGRLLGKSTGWGPLTRARGPVEAGAAAALRDVVATTGAEVGADASVPGRCAEHPLLVGRFRAGGRSAPCLSAAARAGAGVLVTPCFLCFIGLNRYQRGLAPGDPAREVPVLHLSQLIGVACEVAPGRMDLARTTVSARRILQPYMV